MTAARRRERAALRLEGVGFVFQAYNRLDALTARENVELVMNMAGAKGRHDGQRAVELLTMLGLERRFDHLPAGLSGGENQRVTIPPSSCTITCVDGRGTLAADN